VPTAFGKAVVPNLKEIDAGSSTKQTQNQSLYQLTILNSTNLRQKVVKLLLGSLIFTRHLFIFGLPLIPFLLGSLHFTFEMTRFDIGLPKPLIQH
jgi:hypothetical protein